MFNHDLLEFDELSTTNKNGRRFYQTPEGKAYPSVTTVLGYMSDSKEAIEKWKQRVGEKKAQQILTQASRRGTGVHTLCEKYLLNEDIQTSEIMPNQLLLFQQLSPILDKHITKVHALEACLYSDRLQVAGRVDGIVEFDGVLSIIDFKTSLKPKKEEWIVNYFKQASLYACMLYEMKGLKAQQVVVPIAVENTAEPQLFIKQTDKYIGPVVETVKAYHKLIKENQTVVQK